MPTSSIAASRESNDGHSRGSSSTSKLPEFFGQMVFQLVLRNPTTAHQLQIFARSRLCGENLDFLAKVDKYRALLNDVTQSMYEIHKTFIAPNAHNQINLPEYQRSKVNVEMKAAINTALPTLESVFSDAQNDIEHLVYADIYPRFVRHQMSVSAAKALGSDRAKYGGLGDCFVLTDPAKADNPIVYVSDGFVKVTGYSRGEIIPRNCRFLQSHLTDRSAVKRLRTAIENREESVELLLNHKKDGEPFWNLLYTTPLYDAHGNLAFFLGGQINCSTTIHTSSDVLRILAQPQTDEEDQMEDTFSQPITKPARGRTLLSALRGNSRSTIQQRAPGMEGNLLCKIEEMKLKDQMKAFYTAYSNYIVINYGTFLIAFASAGILDLLFPIKAKQSFPGHPVGTDIFKFLGNHGSGSVGWDFKSTVKGTLKSGNPISLEYKLCARPHMGFETFVLHWTPLKNEHGAVTWIVLTFGNEHRA
ncbi:hypothetical protein M433DRAFT_58278 [Acidomyces richmondensis BFW]|nr:MAG: hypothetical protein FE78DRAFT_147598 [Acidomyces sp. 'richmondensis']KYG49886.1 hypothetical protein M433DRAFT_58278 [Acidomyces richmondensis BFW]